MLVVVAIQFGLERQPRNAGAIADAGKPGRSAAAKEIAGTDLPPFPDIILAFIEMTGERPQGVAHLTARTQVAPADAEHEIPVVIAPAGHHILAGKGSCAGKVANADRNFGKAATLLDESHLDIHAAILPGLVAGKRGRTVETIQGIGVAQGGFKPRQCLHGDRITLVGPDARKAQRHLPIGRHPRRGHLHQTDVAEIAHAVEAHRIRFRRHLRAGIADTRREQQGRYPPGKREVRHQIRLGRRKDLFLYLVML